MRRKKTTREYLREATQAHADLAKATRRKSPKTPFEQGLSAAKCHKLMTDNPYMHETSKQSCLSGCRIQTMRDTRC